MAPNAVQKHELKAVLLSKRNASSSLASLQHRKGVYFLSYGYFLLYVLSEMYGLGYDALLDLAT